MRQGKTQVRHQVRQVFILFYTVFISICLTCLTYKRLAHKVKTGEGSSAFYTNRKNFYMSVLR